MTKPWMKGLAKSDLKVDPSSKIVGFRKDYYEIIWIVCKKSFWKVTWNFIRLKDLLSEDILKFYLGDYNRSLIVLRPAR